MGVFNDTLLELETVAASRYGQPVSLCYRHCPSDPPERAWSCWIDGRALDGVWCGDSGHAAMTVALQAFRLPT